ncbi:MAG: putative histidine kinase [Betaproteobacteria bacterium]|nr:putative histidine kinase [Betaproteobacteria bacterium]
MLHKFLTQNRDQLIEHCRLKVSERRASKTNNLPLKFGIPEFLDQVIKTLEVEQTSEPLLSRAISGPGDGKPSSSEIAQTAGHHGRELLLQGFAVDQVVHDYGDLCQSITALAIELNESIQADEFQTLNRCLDNGIADAVKEYVRLRESMLSDWNVITLNERLGSLAHELRNYINSASLAIFAIKSGTVGMTGSTGALLDRSMVSLRTLVDRSLADVRMTAGMPVNFEIVSVAEFIDEVKITASLEAVARGCSLTVEFVDPTLMINVDRHLLFSAVSNLLQNGFKFSAHHMKVTLKAYVSGERIFIDVEDTCGGLQDGIAESMFTPFSQRSSDKSGVGLGLSICRRGVEANHGVVRVRNVPGLGCVFTIDLPRHVEAIVH